MDSRYAATLTHAEDLLNELQFTKRKALLELFASTFATIACSLVFIWFLFLSPTQFETRATLISLLTFPLLINIVMWAYWVIVPVLFMFRFKTRSLVVPGVPSDQDAFQLLYMRYEKIRYSLFIFKRVERVTDIITALSFMSLLATIMYMVITFR